MRTSEPALCLGNLDTSKKSFSNLPPRSYPGGDHGIKLPRCQRQMTFRVFPSTSPLRIMDTTWILGATRSSRINMKRAAGQMRASGTGERDRPQLPQMKEDIALKTDSPWDFRSRLVE